MISICSSYSRVILLLLLSVLSVPLVSGRRWGPKMLPNPNSDKDGVCGRSGRNSAVCDPDHFLSESDADTIDGVINFIHDKTHNYDPPVCEADYKGPQIAFVIVDKMIRIPGERKEDTAYVFAKAIHDSWGVGNADCQNGIVVFFAIHDRSIGLSVGKGLKHIFSGQTVQNYFRDVGVQLRSKQYGHASIYAVNLLGNILSNKYAPTTDSNSSGFPFFFLFIASFLGINYCSKRRITSNHSRYLRCKKILQRMDDDRSNASREQYISTSCPICLEEFDKKNEEQKDEQKKKDKKENKKRVEIPDEEIRLNSGSSSSSSSSTTVTATTTTTTSNANQKEEDKKKSIKTLPCGHTFHESCILDWFATPGNSNATCPICRKPILSDDGDDNSNIEPQQQPEEQQQSLNSTRTPEGWNQYDDEYRFRMNRARFYYPDFITWSMLNDWERNRHNLNHPMATNSTFVAVDPIVVAAAAARSSGGGGSSFSFGGGSSSGGGGGGGSW